MIGNNDTWNTHPGNLTNAADVLVNGDAPVYQLHPIFHVAYTIAKAALTAALLASIGTDNETYLSTRQIVDAMFTKHGQTTGPDLQNFQDPLLKLLPTLAELETHMNLFMLAILSRIS